MRTTLLLVLILPLANVHADDKESLQGNWIAVAAERNGKPADDVKGHQVRFTGDGFSISLNGKLLYAGRFKLFPDANPRAIDFHHTLGKLNGKVWKGIYAVEKQRLRICDNAPDISKPRPASFTTAPDSRYVSVVLERAKE
jgi:uncharacterized protein (TIGR03067 family)